MEELDIAIQQLCADLPLDAPMFFGVKRENGDVVVARLTNFYEMITFSRPSLEDRFRRDDKLDAKFRRLNELAEAKGYENNPDKARLAQWLRKRYPARFGLTVPEE